MRALPFGVRSVHRSQQQTALRTAHVEEYRRRQLLRVHAIEADVRRPAQGTDAH